MSFIAPGRHSSRPRLCRSNGPSLLLYAALLIATGCGGSKSPTAPNEPAAPPAVTVTGLTLSSAGGCSTGGVCIAPGNFTLTATAQRSDGTTADVSSQAQWNSSNSGVAAVSSSGVVTVTNTGDTDVFANFSGRSAGLTVRVPAPWTASGSGNTVFNMPTYVSRVRIRGVWNGQQTSNFIVHIGGKSVVNEILRNTPGNSFEGTYLTNGGVVEIVSSTFISWTFTQVRQ